MIRRHLALWGLLLISALVFTSCGDDDGYGLSPSVPVYKEVAYGFTFNFSSDLCEAATMQVEVAFPNVSKRTFTTDEYASPIYFSATMTVIPQEMTVKVRCLPKNDFRPEAGRIYTLSADMDYTADVLNTAGNPLEPSLSVRKEMLLLDAKQVDHTQVESVLDRLASDAESVFMRTFTFKVYLENGTYRIETP